MPQAGTEIDEFRIATFAKMVQRTDVGISEIADVHVVANRGPIRRRIVFPKYGNLGLFTGTCRKNVRHEMRFRLVTFSVLCRRTRSIEVTQGYEFQSVCAIEAIQHALHDQL